MRLFLRILNFKTTQVFWRNLKSWNISLIFVFLRSDRMDRTNVFLISTLFSTFEEHPRPRKVTRCANNQRDHSALWSRCVYIVCIPRISRCTKAFTTFSNIVQHTRFPWHTSKMSPHIQTASYVHLRIATKIFSTINTLSINT